MEMRARRGVEDGSRGVENETATRGHVKLDTSDHRASRNAVERYVGRDRRGAPSREDRNIDLLKDLRDVTALVERFTRSFEHAAAVGVFDLPKVQREEALRIVAETGARGARLLGSVVLELDLTAELDVILDDK
jgi:hypothetical protein